MAQYCARRGWLVGPARRLPVDASEWLIEAAAELIGCNSLKCAHCHAPVRHWLGWRAKRTLTGATLARLYEADATADLSAFAEAAPARLYACRCSHGVEEKEHALDDDPHDDEATLPAWGCSGHPPATLPLGMNGIHVDRATDVEALAARVLAGDVPQTAPERERRAPAAWLRRLYLRLRAAADGPTLSRRLSTAIAHAAQGHDEMVRLRAVEFFIALPDADGKREMLALASGQGSVGERLEFAWAVFLEDNLENDDAAKVARAWVPQMRDLARKRLTEALARQSSAAPNRPGQSVAVVPEVRVSSAPMSSVVEGVELTPSVDVRQLVRQQLAGDGPGLPVDGEMDPVDWLIRCEPKLRGTPYHRPLCGAVAECLRDRDVRLRAQAIHFFRNLPAAPGAETIATLWRGERRLFAGVDDPLHPGSTLEHELLSVVGLRLDLHRAEDLGAARLAAVQPGLGSAVAGGLTGHDPEWLLRHAVDVVTHTPAAGVIILYRLQQMRRPLLPLGENLAALAARDPRFFELLDNFIDDAAAKRAIVAGAQSARR